MGLNWTRRLESTVRHWRLPCAEHQVLRRNNRASGAELSWVARRTGAFRWDHRRSILFSVPILEKTRAMDLCSKQGHDAGRSQGIDSVESRDGRVASNAVSLRPW